MGRFSSLCADPNLGILPKINKVDQEQRLCMLKEWKIMNDFQNGISSITKSVVRLQNEIHPNILMFGGIDLLKPNEYVIGATMFLYESHKEKWSFFGTLPEPRSYHATAFINGKVFVTGGFDPLNVINGESIATNVTFQLNIRSKRWHKISPMHYARACHGMIAAEEKLYVFGGKDKSGNLLNTAESYSVSFGCWTEIKLMPQSLMGIGIAYLEGVIYIIGGVLSTNNNNSLTNEVFLYDVQNNRWTTGCSLPKPLAYCSAITVRREIWIFGGLDPNGSTNTVYKFSNSNLWEQKLTMNRARHSMACTKINKHIYLLGGISSVNQNSLDDMDIFDVDSCAITPGTTIPCKTTGATALTISTDYMKSGRSLIKSPDEITQYKAAKVIQKSFRHYRDSKWNECNSEESYYIKSVGTTRCNYCLGEFQSQYELNKKINSPALITTWPPKPNPNLPSVVVYEVLGQTHPLAKYPLSERRFYMNMSPFTDPNLGMIPRLDNLYTKTRGVVGLKKIEFLPAYLQKMPSISKLQDPDVPVIAFFGGINPRDPLNANYGRTVLRYYPEKDVWEYYGMMPEPKNHHAALFLHDNIYITGGYNPDKRYCGEMIATKSCYSFDVKDNKWREIRDMEIARAHHGMVTINDKIYVIGGRGCDGRALDSIEEYDVHSNAWKQLSSMSIPCMAMAVVSYKNKIWLMGGLQLINDQSYYMNEDMRSPMTTDVYCYDVNTETWTAKAPLKIPRAFSSAVVIDEKIWLCGGCEGNISRGKKDYFVSVNLIDVYDPETNKWETKTILNVPRHCTTVTTLERMLYVFCGINSHEWIPLYKNEVYFLDDNSIHSIQNLPVPITGAFAVAIPPIRPIFRTLSFVRIVKRRLNKVRPVII